MRKGVLPAMIGGLVALVGLVFGAVGAANLAATAHLLEIGKRAEGTVVDLGVRHQAGNASRSDTVVPIIEFQTSSGQRVRFEDGTGRSPGTYHVGDKLPVSYDSNDPSHAQLATFAGLYLFGLLFGGIGGLAAIAGGVVLAFGVRAILLRRWLLRYGQRIQATPSFVGLDMSYTSNGKNPYIVRATFRDPLTGQSYDAASDGVWDDPEPALAGNPYVTVLYDPRKPKRCTIQL